MCPVLDEKVETSESVRLQKSRWAHAKISELGHFLCRLLLGPNLNFVTTPPLPYPSSNKPSALSSQPLLLHRNHCSCFGWDHSHTAVLVLTVAEIAVEIEVATGAGIARLLVVSEVAKPRFGGDVVDMRGSIVRVG